jgi:hypothetical protein
MKTTFNIALLLWLVVGFLSVGVVSFFALKALYSLL